MFLRGIKFRGNTFVHTWLSKRGTRFINELLDGIGSERLTWLIANKKDISSFVTPEQLKQKYPMLNNPMVKENQGDFPNEEIYKWIPEGYRDFFERTEGGKEWALKQIKFLRGIMIPS